MVHEVLVLSRHWIEYKLVLPGDYVIALVNDLC